jgi:beta-galactosidase
MVSPLEVNVYSSCAEVELFINGRSLGKKRTDRSTEFIATWNVPYQAGTLKAVGYREGKEVGSTELKSAGEVVALKAMADRMTISGDGQDLSYVTVELVDAKGVRNPTAENLVRFALTGPGEMIAVQMRIR